MIQVEQVTKEFQQKTMPITALDSLSLMIPRRQSVAIVGPSGSGKSTLLNLIGALDRPTRGEVRLDGIPLGGLSDDGLTRLRRDTIGFIFQFFNLLPSLSCLDNVALPLHLHGWPRKKAIDRAKELLNRVGLSARLSHRPDELSGGQRQRVAIARALTIQPPVLLADEPTGNLDSTTGREILDLLNSVHGQFGSTMVIVTHDTRVARCCERTVAIRDGRIESDSMWSTCATAEVPVAVSASADAERAD